MEYILEKLEVHTLAERFSDDIWNFVVQWDHFNKDTLGKQLVRAADSNSAIFPKGMAATFIKKANNFIFTRAAQFRKQNHGYQNAYY